MKIILEKSNTKLISAYIEKHYTGCRYERLPGSNYHYKVYNTVLGDITIHFDVSTKYQKVKVPGSKIPEDAIWKDNHFEKDGIIYEGPYYCTKEANKTINKVVNANEFKSKHIISREV